MQWRTLIHLRLWGRPLWRLLAVVALLFLAAACFLGWSIAVLNCVHLGIDYGLAVALAGAIGATCLLWGGAQALISRAAYELGVDVRAAPARRWLGAGLGLSFMAGRCTDGPEIASQYGEPC